MLSNHHPVPLLNSRPLHEMKLATRMEKEVVAIPGAVILKTWENPTHVIGSFKRKRKAAWKLIFLSTKMVQRSELLPWTTTLWGMSTVMLRKTGWNPRKEADLRPPHNECPTPFSFFPMNIIIWNSRGALKPNFQSHVRELA